jgi:hypothetical protein
VQALAASFDDFSAVISLCISCAAFSLR